MCVILLTNALSFPLDLRVRRAATSSSSLDEHVPNRSFHHVLYWSHTSNTAACLEWDSNLWTPPGHVWNMTSLTCVSSVFSNSSSCRRKPRLGPAHGLDALTAARDSTHPRPVTVMMYATTRVTLRDTPATLRAQNTSEGWQRRRSFCYSEITSSPVDQTTFTSQPWLVDERDTFPEELNPGSSTTNTESAVIDTGSTPSIFMTYTNPLILTLKYGGTRIIGKVLQYTQNIRCICKLPWYVCCYMCTVL